MNDGLKILIANDDGIGSEGIWRLARIAAQLGEVWVAAPSSQCSAMSQKLTIFDHIDIRKVTPPVPVRAAYSISGTPADCVKLALNHLLPEKPDFVFSGINYGYNAGQDIAYSGTIGAAMEAVMNGVPAIAFSAQHDGSTDVTEKYLLPVAQELMASPPAPGEIWNVNFPGCELDAFRGICRDCPIGRVNLYDNVYSESLLPDGTIRLNIHSSPVPLSAVTEHCDVRAVLAGYIAIGKVKSMVL